MPVIVLNNLPAIKMLADENVAVINSQRAQTQDIRPLEILILNLMPTKIATENQLIRVLSNTPLQVRVTFLQTETYEAKNIHPEHLESFYKTFEQIKNDCFDGIIITGAPVETLDFDEVDYWEELSRILEWSESHVFSSVHICWGAQAGLYYRYGFKKFNLDEKISGIYPHTLHKSHHPLFKGFDDVFQVPHSRYTFTNLEEISKVSNLEILATSVEAGVYLVATRNLREIYLTGHPEYDTETLNLEYLRDLKRGVSTSHPKNYFLNDNPKLTIVNNWRSHSYLFFANWLNYIYQETPYNIEEIKELHQICQS